MTQQQQLLWKKLTEEVRDSGMDNLHARELYDEVCKLLNMSDKVLLAITEKDGGLEVKLNEGVYGNLAVVGLLEKLKLTILEGEAEEESVSVSTSKYQKYDA